RPWPARTFCTSSRMTPWGTGTHDSVRAGVGVSWTCSRRTAAAPQWSIRLHLRMGGTPLVEKTVVGNKMPLPLLGPGEGAGRGGGPARGLFTVFEGLEMPFLAQDGQDFQVAAMAPLFKAGTAAEAALPVQADVVADPGTLAGGLLEGVDFAPVRGH